VLSDLTGISTARSDRHQHRRTLVPVDQARLGPVYVGQRAANDREGIDSPEHTKQPAKHANRN